MSAPASRQLSAPPLVPCPGCKRPTEYVTTNRYRPFCSDRCKRTDLGAWASERYRVAADTPPDADDLSGR